MAERWAWLRPDLRVKRWLIEAERTGVPCSHGQNPHQRRLGSIPAGDQPPF